MTLSVTLALLVCTLILLAACILQDRKPVNPAKPRLLPYRLIMLFLIVVILATLAHVVSLVTGTTVMPRRRRGL